MSKVIIKDYYRIVIHFKNTKSLSLRRFSNERDLNYINEFCDRVREKPEVLKVECSIRGIDFE